MMMDIYLHNALIAHNENSYHYRKIIESPLCKAKVQFVGQIIKDKTEPN